MQSNLFAQTVIREKFIISDSFVIKSISSGLCTVDFQLDWTNPEKRIDAHLYYNQDKTVNSGWQYGGHIKISADCFISEGNGGVEFAFHTDYYANKPWSYTYRIFVNDVEVQSDTIADETYSGAGFTYYIIHFSPKVFSSFNLSVAYLDDDLRISNNESAYIYAPLTFDCQRIPNLTDSSLVVLSIEPDDVDLVLVDHKTGVILGSNHTTIFKDIRENGYRISLGNCYLSDREKVFTLTASTEGLTLYYEIKVAPNIDIYFLEPYITLLPGEEKLDEIYSNAFDKEGCNIELSTTPVFDVSIVGDNNSSILLRNPKTGFIGNTLNNVPLLEGDPSFYVVVSDSINDYGNDIFIRIQLPDGTVLDEQQVSLLPNDIAVKFDKEKISAGDTTLIYLKRIDNLGNEVDFNSNQDFYLRTNNEFGYFLYTDSYSGKEIPTAGITGLQPFKFVAADDIPFPDVKNNIKAVAYVDDAILYGIGNIIIKNKRLNVMFEKSDLSAGDTVNVVVNMIDSDGNISELPDTTHFEIGIKDGCEIGNVLTNNGEIGQYFLGIQKPLRFVMNDTITVDTSNIVLRIGIPRKPKIEVPPISASSIREGKKKTRNLYRSLSQNYSIKNNLSISDEYYCSFNEFMYDNHAFAVGNVGKVKIEIIYPQANSPNETISSVPEMPTVICKARLKNYKGEQVTYEWEYWVSNEFAREETKENGSIDLCSRIGKIGIEDTYSEDYSEITEWTVPFVVSNLKSFSAIAPKPERKFNNDYKGDCDLQLTSWNYGNEIFTGGNVWVKVRAKDKNGKLIAWDTLSANKILGINASGVLQNPTVAMINDAVSGLDCDIKALMMQESSRNHFGYGGMPKYGPPNGFGLMQLDNPAPTELEMWNWKANLAGGIRIYNSYKPNAIKYVNNLFGVDSVTIEQQLKEAWQRYNGGKYWGRDIKSGAVKKIAFDKKGNEIFHSERCWDYYKSLGCN